MQENNKPDCKSAISSGNSQFTSTTLCAQQTLGKLPSLNSGEQKATGMA